jgi:hypothetical protein
MTIRTSIPEERGEPLPIDLGPILIKKNLERPENFGPEAERMTLQY